MVKLCWVDPFVSIGRIDQAAIKNEGHRKRCPDPTLIGSIGARVNTPEVAPKKALFNHIS